MGLRYLRPVLDRTRFKRALTVLAGVLLGQLWLYGPALLGSKLLLPLDVLTAPGIYLPATEEHGVHLENFHLSDLVYLSEPMRRFANEELRAGRLPMWADYQYAGAPFLGPKFSPFVAPQYLVKTPRVIAWMQVVAATVAGLGMFLFCRRVLRVGFWPGAVAGWAYPLTGFFVFWQGYYLVWPVYWLPWLLVSVESTVRGRWAWAPIGLALTTCLTVISGNVDTAGQALIVAGLFALWRLATGQRTAAETVHARPRWRTAVRTGAAFALGLMLAAPHVLPTADYSRRGARIQLRQQGREERPPVGLAALPQVALPDMYGAQAKARTGFRYARETQAESSAGAYAGLIAILLLGPLAFRDRSRSGLAWFCGGAAVLGSSWCLNVPGVVDFLRLPGLNLMSHNRFVFATAFGVLALAVLGWEQARTGVERKWLVLPLALLGTTFCWCAYRSLVLPEAFQSLGGLLEKAGSGGVGWITDAESVSYAQDMFRLHYMVAAAMSGLGLAGVFGLWKGAVRATSTGLGLLVMLDLLWFGRGRSVLSSPDLYYPALPAAAILARGSDTERVVAYKTLPPQLLSVFGLRDIRGYDGVDPARYLELLGLSGDRPGNFDYAALQWFTPVVGLTAEGNVRLHPVLDMLGVTHVIFRGKPTAGTRPVAHFEPYWVLANSNALPRAFVPRRVQTEVDARKRLALMGAEGFDARELGIVEEPIELSQNGPCQGVVKIERDEPTMVDLGLEMETDGLVVLGDRWDPGWKAYLDGKMTRVMVADHDLRGVRVFKGSRTLSFRYEPESFQAGLRWAAYGAFGLLTWGCVEATWGKNRRGEGKDQATKVTGP